jgi:pimeloyl-ACP methyl ester carboxylesterase
MHTPFDPAPNESKYGCVVLVHGLYGSAVWEYEQEQEKDERDWMAPCAQKIEERMKRENVGEPNICLVDWKAAARPSQHYTLPRFGQKNLIADLAAIRPEAYQIGDSVAIQLAKLIYEKKIDPTKPLHLIGHSAGGFIVARIARRLNELGLVSKGNLLHVTILDTPAPGPDIAELRDIYTPGAVDFYVTSAVGGKEPRKEGRLDWVTDVPSDKPRPPWWKLWQALLAVKHEHMWAYQWFQLTVLDPNTPPIGEGFNKSPLLTQAQTGSSR